MAEQVVKQREAEFDAAERLAKIRQRAKLQLDQPRLGLATAKS